MRTILCRLLVFSLLVPGQEAFASDTALELARATDIVGKWSADQHLYVKGKLGVSPERLSALEKWLDANASHWTILLAANAEGESFTDQEGRDQRGVDAVEYAVGRGLPRTTAFADLVDARTGERNGAGLVIVLNERTFSYTGSEAQNRRMLGEEQWQGNLDRPAFRAMSNGGRLVDAVKDTVKEVESRLTQQLALEQRARERALFEARQQRDNARNALREARSELEELETETTDFARGIPDGDGDLLRPDLTAMGSEIEAGEARLADGDGAAAARVAGSVRDWVRGQRQAMAAHKTAPAGFDALAKRIEETSRDEGDEPWGAERLAQAKVELGKARTAHERGDSSYAAIFENARQGTDSAEEEIARAKAERERRILAEQRAARAAEMRTARLRTTGIAGGGILAALLAGGGVAMNRRRRPAKAEAGELLANRETAAHEKRDGLFALLDRTTVVVGSSAELSERGYQGETLRLSEQTISDVDELFIMSSAVERVLRQARELVDPGVGMRGAMNLVASENFHQAMRLLRDEPITFTPDEGIELIVRGDKEETQSLLGKLESYQPFALSFHDLIGEFNARAARALASLDRIETAWATIHGTLDDAEADLEKAGARAAAVSGRASEDRLFALPALSGTWLKSARADLDSAVAMAAGDPVRSLDEPVPLARRKATEALALCNAVEHAREISMPKLRESDEALEAAGHATGWIADALRALSDQADTLCLAGASEPVAERIAAFGEDFAALVGRASGAVALSVRMRDKAAPALETFGEAIASARLEIGKVLALPPDRILHEKDADPDDRLAEGWRQHAAATAAINRGGVEEAESALNAVGRLVEEGNALLSDSRTSLYEHAGAAADRRARKEALEHVVDRNGVILEELKEDYSGEALLADVSDTAPGTAEASIAGNIERTEEAMARSWSLTDRADAAYREARLLEAAALLEDAEEEQALCDQWLAAILAQKNRIEQTEAANSQKLEQVEREAAGLRQALPDARVMVTTREEFSKRARALENVRENLKASRRDPFALARELARLDETLDGVAKAIEDDLRWFAETQRSLGEAAAALESAHRLSHQVATDAIPDSPRMLEMQEEVGRLRLREQELRKQSQEPHGDWRAIDAELDEITAAASNITGEMRGELEHAQAAVAALASARAAVRDASGWSGGYGVRITGSPGADFLHGAAELLQRGSYRESQRRAEDAARSARQAVSEAKALVARHRAEEQRREDERRRAAQRRRSSVSTGSSSSFGGRSRSSGSSMGRSSFSSSSRSGSGMGRSGW